MNIANTMSDKTWAITTFFNPQNYQNKIYNYRLFQENLRSQRIKLLTIECAFKNKEFQLKKGEADILISVRSHSILWQKERLLNVALKHLPSECENIVWIDADIIFLNQAWVAETEQLLEQYPIIQPFVKAVYLNKNEPLKDFWDNKIPSERFKSGYAFYFNKNKEAAVDYGVAGGFAWAGKKKIFDTCGFYDLGIIGGGDWIMNKAFAAVDDGGNNRPLQIWTQNIQKFVKGNIYFAPGRVAHLYHGSIKNRLYDNRTSILLRNGFNPERDLCLNADDCWQWSNTAPAALKKEIKNYFLRRNENDSLIKKTRNIINLVFKILLPQIIGRAGILIKRISPPLYHFLKRK